MAVAAIYYLMPAGQGKPAPAMYLADIFNNPGLWRVTFGTIRPQGAFVQILVTIQTLAFRIPKNQRFMAGTAVDRPMLADQPEFGTVMVKLDFPGINLPSGGGMAVGTINFKALPVRGLSMKH